MKVIGYKIKSKEELEALAKEHGCSKSFGSAHGFANCMVGPMWDLCGEEYFTDEKPKDDARCEGVQEITLDRWVWDTRWLEPIYEEIEVEGGPMVLT